MFFLSKERKMKIEKFFQEKFILKNSEMSLIIENGSYKISCKFDIENKTEAYKLKTYGIKIKVGTVRHSDIHEFSSFDVRVLKPKTDSPFSQSFFIPSAWNEEMENLADHAVVPEMYVSLYYLNQFKENDFISFEKARPSFTVVTI